VINRTSPSTCAEEAIQTQDSGLGTTYERWALYRFLERIRREYGLRSVLEGPGDGITGIAYLNSLGLARAGAQVTLASTEPQRAAFARDVWSRYAPPTHQADVRMIEAPGSLDGFEDGYDLAWNFNIINRHPNPSGLLEQMARASRRYVLVVVPNRKNYGFFLHRLQHRASGEAWDHGPMELLAAAPFQKMFVALGLRVREVAWVDCPWWPDIVDFGAMLTSFLPFLNGAARRLKPENRLAWPADGLPYFAPQEYPQVHQRMQRLALFEDCRWKGITQRFAHHVAILAEKA